MQKQRHWVGLMIKTAFQVVELTLDTDDNVIDRRTVPYPYPTHKDAVDTIESFVTRLTKSGYEPNGDFWWGITGDGKSRVRFIIERV
jgi:hypothetical protein